MANLPTFTIKINIMQANIPYMDSLGIIALLHYFLEYLEHIYA